MDPMPIRTIREEREGGEGDIHKRFCHVRDLENRR